MLLLLLGPLPLLLMVAVAFAVLPLLLLARFSDAAVSVALSWMSSFACEAKGKDRHVSMPG